MRWTSGCRTTILWRKVSKGNTRNIGQNMQNLTQSGTRAVRQINLGNIAGDDDCRAKPDTGQKHLHLFHCRVLALINDDKGVIQCTPPHVGQRRNLDDILFDQLLHLVKTDQFIQRIVKRPQVWINFLAEVTG